MPIEEVVACDLTDWIHTPPSGKVAIDPVLGRIAFADAQTEPPLVTFHYGFSDDMGGGEYDRAPTFDALLNPVESVPSPHTTIQDALSAVTAGGVVEISDSARYAETPTIDVNAGERVEVRGDNEHRPTLVLGGEVRRRQLGLRMAAHARAQCVRAQRVGAPNGPVHTDCSHQTSFVQRSPS